MYIRTYVANAWLMEENEMDNVQKNFFKFAPVSALVPFREDTVQCS